MLRVLAVLLLLGIASPVAPVLAGTGAPVIELTPLSNTSSTGDRTLSGVVITDADGVQTTPGLRPRLYYREVLESDAFVGNTSADNGWKFVETADTASPFSFTLDVSLLTGPLMTGQHVVYFVVAQDMAVTPNVGTNGAVFASPATSVDLQPAQAPVTNVVNEYIVLAPISGTKTVCASGCDYTSLTKSGGAFEAIELSSLTGNLDLVISGDLDEDGNHALPEWVEDGVGGYTLTIRPDSAVLRTVSGSGDFPGLIRLEGPDRVVIDGRFDGNGKFLRFRNTHGSHPTIVLDHGATNNTIQSCIIEGGNTNDTFSGTIEFGFNSGGTGNSDNLIADCDVRDRSDVPGIPRAAIVGESANPPNDDNTITRCNVFNWNDVGVLVNPGDEATGWTISESSFYQTAPRISDRLAAISLGRGSGYQVLDNRIGGTAPGAGGAFLATSGAFLGIELTLLGDSPRSSIQGNIIKNIRSTMTGLDGCYGLFLGGGPADIGNIRGNTVGSSNPDERFEVNGEGRGFYLDSPSAVTFSNNSVINMTMTATPDPGQIYVGIDAHGTGDYTIVDNTVMNLTNTSTSTQIDGGALIAGLDVESTGVHTVVGNTVSNVGVSSTLPVAARNNRAWGIFIGNSAVGTRIERNKVNNVYGASPSVGARADIIVGLQSQAGANATYANNMITLDAGAPSDRFVRGIFDSSTTPTQVAYLFNSVLIRGTSTGDNPTYAFLRTQNATVTLRNNIFSNVRTAATGFNVALANTTGTDGWPATASDYNLLFNLDSTHLTQWLGSAAQNNGDLAAFRTSTGGEMHSLNGDPAFVSDEDLHLSRTGIAAGAGIPFGNVTTDFDGDSRPSVAPDIGADEVIDVPALRLMAGSFVTWLAAMLCLSRMTRARHHRA